MFQKARLSLKIVTAACCIAFGYTMPAQATILTFDIHDPVYPTEQYPEGFAVDQTYGDRVTSSPVVTGTTTFDYGVGAEGYTPNVTVGYGPASIFTGGPSLWRYDYGDLTGVLYQGSTFTGIGNDYDYLEIVFQADPGYDVLLYGFDLGGWFHQDYTVNSVSVYDSNLNLFFPDLNRIYYDPDALIAGAGPSHSTYTFGTPLEGNTITIFIDANNLEADSEFIGLDNIRIGQALAPASVPEPGSLWLMAAGAALVAFRRKRH